jgi:2-polyprenyl-6-methoxyphenol hydroxylase-like FAD-dependent oxidoreductase
MPERRKIVVAGAGPVGMVGAYRLALAGFDVLVLEAGQELSQDSKASTMHPPTLELFEELGIIDEVLEQGLEAPVFQHRDRTEGVLAELDLSELADLTPYPYRIQLEQNKLTRLIRPKLEALPNAELRFGVRAVRAEDAGDSARLYVEGSDEPIECDWLLGCDGSNSQVRQSLGFQFPGETFPERFIVMSTTHDFREQIPDLADVAYISDPEEWVVLLRTPDHWRATLPVPEWVDPDYAVSRERIEERLQAIAPIDGEYDLLEYSIYNINQRVADHFAQNRVLIAGDSAHLNNPLGGLGMNGGIHDVWSAVDTILAVERDGKDWRKAVDIYGRIRSVTTHEFTQRLTKENRANLKEADAAKRAARNEEMRGLMTDAAARREYLIRAAMLGTAKSALAQCREELAAI